MFGDSMLKSAVTNQLGQSGEGWLSHRQTERHKAREKYYGLDGGMGAGEAEVDVSRGQFSDKGLRRTDEVGKL